MRTLKYIPAIIFIFLVSCSQNRINDNTGSNSSDWQNDSLEVINSIKKVYKWHDSAKTELPDFSVLIVDSFQTGLDFASFEKTLKAIKESQLFSNVFIANYTELAELIDHKLTTANPRYLNEINFAYQESDLWTYFQDDAEYFWNNLIISDFSLSSDSASFKWHIQDKYAKSHKYLVKLVKENKQWLVAYLDGFNKKMYPQ